ncbi:MAG: penicillin-binding protein 2 [Deltaproteobacteria bacterium]|nr:penicillin-binding protein 2 [Deltaproteobacteria bacterium]
MMENKYIKLRILLVGIIFITAFAAIAAKAVHLQIYRSHWLSQKASDQYEKSLTTSGKRGIIYDRNLSEMAVSINVTSIAAYPARVDNPKATAKALAGVLDLDARSLQSKLTGKKSFVWIKRQSTAKETNAVKELEIPGINFVTEYNRFYPQTTLAAQALGFSGMDGTGLEGIEFYYNQQLKGVDLNFTIFKDALGNGFSAGPGQSTDTSGHNLVLTIDNTIQYIAESALQEAVYEYSALSGLALVMNPQTGAVLALAHYPLFNPNSYADFEKSIWRNRALTDTFEPGSTMKIFSAAAALEHGKITPNEIFFCENGAYKIGKNVVHDTHKYGWLSLQQIIKYSSNIGAVKVVEKMGARNLHRTFRDFGFGQKTGIDSPGETPGSLPHYSSWSKIDTGAISFGHGISVSAVQMITAISAIANGGNLMKPYLVRAIVDQNGNIVNAVKPQKVRTVISARTATIVKNILKTVITEVGTGVNAALDGYTACGKTGTARKLDKNGEYSKTRHTASFIGFAPADDPEIAILVIIDEPQGKYYGGIVAAPVFKKISQQTLNYLNVPPEAGPTKLRVSRDNGAKG